MCSKNLVGLQNTYWLVVRTIIQLTCAQQGGVYMAQKKIGRPPSDDSMKDRIFIRVDNDTKAKLQECIDTLETTRSDVVRKGIDMVHKSLRK